MTFSIIQKSQLEGADRVDAEYYQPEYLEWQKNLTNFHLRELSEITSKVDVGFVSSMTSHFQETGIPLLRTQNVQEFTLNLDDVTYIDEEFHEKLRKSQIFPGYLLLARSGSIGNVGVVPQNFPKSNSADIILIRVSSKNYLPEFIAVFLNSKYGRFQIERGASGGLQGHINLFTLEQLKIPEFVRSFQEEIADLVQKGLSEVEESKTIYQQAENLLLEELGLKDFKIPEDLSYIVNYSDTENVDRVDADYFQPKYEFLIENLGNKKRLSEFAKRTNRPPKIELEKEYNYMEISDVNIGNGEIVSNKVIGKELPANAKIKISGGELIVSKVRPTRGAIAIIPDEFSQDFVASGAFSVFEIASPTREYLQVVLRLFIGKLQMDRPTTGTSYPTITDQDIENIWVPVLPKETQVKIADLVKKSHEARKKSKELLEQAKRKVEEMIENRSK